MFDLQHWDYVEEFSAEEIAGLMVDFDPRVLGTALGQQTIEPPLRRIESDYNRTCEAVKMIFIMYGGAEVEAKLKAIGPSLFSVGLQTALDNYSWMEQPQVVLDWINSTDALIDRQRFERAVISQWLTQSNLKSKYNFNKQDYGHTATGAQLNQSTWPWGPHTTKDLEDLKAAALHWWSKYRPSDPMTAPKKESVIRWLMDERGTVEDKAKTIASILRPRDLKSGPRVKNVDKK